MCRPMYVCTRMYVCALKMLKMLPTNVVILSQISTTNVLSITSFMGEIVPRITTFVEGIFTTFVGDGYHICGNYYICGLCIPQYFHGGGGGGGGTAPGTQDLHL